MNRKKIGEEEIEIKLTDADELIEYFSGDHHKKSVSKKNEPEMFSLITFLENDGARLDHLIQFFSSKIGNHQKYNQTEKLLENQIIFSEDLKEQIINNSLPILSPINISLADLFNRQFKKHS